MAVPVAIYLAFNAGGSGAHGWGAAMSTDTAFALGVLALLAPRGTRLRVRLLTLVVVDDLVALLVIATVYTDHVSMTAARCSRSASSRVLLALRYAPFAWRTRRPWCSASRSGSRCSSPGIDPVIAGLAVGLVTSAYRRRAATSSG